MMLRSNSSSHRSVYIAELFTPTCREHPAVIKADKAARATHTRKARTHTEAIPTPKAKAATARQVHPAVLVAILLQVNRRTEAIRTLRIPAAPKVAIRRNKVAAILLNRVAILEDNKLAEASRPMLKARNG